MQANRPAPYMSWAERRVLLAEHLPPSYWTALEKLDDDTWTAWTPCITYDMFRTADFESAVEIAKIRIARRIRNIVEQGQRMPGPDLSLEAAQLADERQRGAFTGYVTALREHSSSSSPVPPKVVVERRWLQVAVDLTLAEVPADPGIQAVREEDLVMRERQQHLGIRTYEETSSDEESGDEEPEDEPMDVGAEGGDGDFLHGARVISDLDDEEDDEDEEGEEFEDREATIRAARVVAEEEAARLARMSAITAEQSEVMRNDVSQLRLLLESGQGGEGAHASSESLRNAIQPSQAQELSNVLTRVGTQVDDMIAFVRNLGSIMPASEAIMIREMLARVRRNANLAAGAMDTVREAIELISPSNDSPTPAVQNRQPTAAAEAERPQTQPQPTSRAPFPRTAASIASLAAEVRASAAAAAEQRAAAELRALGQFGDATGARGRVARMHSLPRLTNELDSVPGLNPIYRETMEASRRAFVRRMRSLTSIDPGSGGRAGRARAARMSQPVRGGAEDDEGSADDYELQPRARLWKEGEASLR